jgi:hypothetical protein
MRLVTAPLLPLAQRDTATLGSDHPGPRPPLPRVKGALQASLLMPPGCERAGGSAAYARSGRATVVSADADLTPAVPGGCERQAPGGTWRLHVVLRPGAGLPRRRQDRGRTGNDRRAAEDHPHPALPRTRGRQPPRPPEHVPLPAGRLSEHPPAPTTRSINAGRARRPAQRRVASGALLHLHVRGTVRTSRRRRHRTTHAADRTQPMRARSGT